MLRTEGKCFRMSCCSVDLAVPASKCSGGVFADPWRVLVARVAELAPDRRGPPPTYKKGFIVFYCTIRVGV